MNRQDLPRYHQPDTPISVSQNEAKYKNMRLMLLITLILSAVNCITVLIADVFFYFSAYLPLVLISVGTYMANAMQMPALYIIMALLALLTLVPYLLCYLFSKKKVGWMIAALVIFSVDTVLLMVDLMTNFNATLVVCMAFHVYEIVMLALGVKYGLDMNREQETATIAGADSSVMGYDPYAAFVPQSDGSYVDSSAGGYTDVCRKITVVRQKSFVGCAVKLYCYAGNRQVLELKNGQTDTFEATGESFFLRVGTANGLTTGQIQIPMGALDIGYEVSVKMGMVSNTVEIRQIF